MNDREPQWDDEVTEEIVEPVVEITEPTIPMPESDMVRPQEGVAVDFQTFLNTPR